MPDSFHELQHEVFRLHGQQRYARALELIGQGLAQYPDYGARMTFWAVCLECRLNRPNEALARLESLVAEGGWVNPQRLRADEDLAPLRDTRRLAELASICESRRESEQSHVRPELGVEPPLSPGDYPPLVVALHMMGGSIGEARENWLPMTEMGWLLAMPQGTQLMGPGEFGWSERTSDQVAQQLEELRETQPFDPQRVLFGGASRGARHAVEMAVSGEPLPAKGFVAIVGAPPVDSLRPHLTRARTQGVRGVFITGEQDIALSRARDAHQLLDRAGLEVRLEVLPGLGHLYPTDLPRLLRDAVEFIFS